jgi:hypothetical protein
MMDFFSGFGADENFYRSSGAVKGLADSFFSDKQKQAG